MARDLVGRLRRTVGAPGNLVQLRSLSLEVILPSVRKMLDQEWRDSGLRMRTGQLYAASVTHARVISTANGARVVFGQGYSQSTYDAGAYYQKARRPFFSLTGRGAEVKALYMRAFRRSVRAFIS